MPYDALRPYWTITVKYENGVQNTTHCNALYQMSQAVLELTNTENGPIVEITAK